ARRPDRPRAGTAHDQWPRRAGARGEHGRDVPALPDPAVRVAVRDRARGCGRRRGGDPARDPGVEAAGGGIAPGGGVGETMIPLRYNVRSLLVRRATTIATVVGIGLVVAV